MSGARDVLGELLIAKGLVPNEFILNLNRSLTSPYGEELPAPWNLPSRLFRFPIEVGDFTTKAQRSIGLMHPLLGEHPFVKRVAAELGDLGHTLSPQGAPNCCGVSKQRSGCWWHAIDLMSAGYWRELLATRQFTTPEDIAQAVAFSLDTGRDVEGQRPRLTTKDARQVMAAIDAPAPADAIVLIRELMKPSPVRQDKGPERWPINPGRTVDPRRTAWSRIFGIEQGWFVRDRTGFLQWSEPGRDRFAAGAGASTFVETRTGQIAFAF